MNIKYIVPSVGVVLVSALLLANDNDADSTVSIQAEHKYQNVKEKKLNQYVTDENKFDNENLAAVTQILVEQESDNEYRTIPSDIDIYKNKLSSALSDKGGPEQGRVVRVTHIPVWDLPSDTSIIALKNVQFSTSKDYIPDFSTGDRRVYVQFSKVLSESDRKSLLSSGVLLDDYFAANTWLIKANPEIVNEIKKMDEFSGFAEVMPLDKVSKELANGEIPSYAQLGSNLVLEAALHKNYSKEKIYKKLGEFSIVDIQFTNGHVSFKAPVEVIRSIAEIDEIAYLDFVSPPKEYSNVNAAALSNINNIQVNLGLNGNGISVGQWEGDNPDPNHQDFFDNMGNTRVAIMDNVNNCAANVNNCGDHATHVAGTIIGDGTGNNNATGMAPAATLSSWDWNGAQLIRKWPMRQRKTRLILRHIPGVGV